MAGVTPASWGPVTLPANTVSQPSANGPGIPHPATPIVKPPTNNIQKPKKPSPPPVAKTKKPPAKKRKPSALDKYLAGDTTYQQQLAEFNKSQADYNSTYNTQVSQTNRDYANTRRQMLLQGQKDRMDQQEEFGGRGILHSGVFAKALADYNTGYNTQMQNLVTGLSDKLGDLGTQRKQFYGQLALQKNAARQDAIRRRAEKLGI